MSRLFQLESFTDLKTTTPGTPDISSEDIEAARLAGYDAGYKSGWDDALAGVEADQAKISEEFARNLKDLGFTYHEARAHVISSLEPMVEALLDALFPRFASEAIAAHINAVIHNHADKAASQPILVRVSPEDHDALRGILPHDHSVPLDIIAEPALPIGQAQIVLGKSEYSIDLSDVVETTRSALSALRESNERTLKRA